MAVDTRNKRFSMMGLALASLSVLPAPDATIDQFDRLQLRYLYSGIAAGAAVPIVPDLVELTLTFTRTVTLETVFTRTVNLTVER